MFRELDEELDEESRNKIIKNYIIKINNQLYNLKSALDVDLDGINYIEPIGDGVPGLSVEEDYDLAMKASIEKSKSDRKKYLEEKMLKDTRPTEEGGYVAPPEVENTDIDWNNVKISPFDKEKVMQEIRLAKKGEIKFNDLTKVKTEYKWDPDEFLSTFKFLESSKKYKGQFLTTVVFNSALLNKLSKHEGLENCMDNIYKGKYVMISVYDISAANTPGKEKFKNIYIGLNYNTRDGGLEFDAMGVSNSTKISVDKSQKKQAIEYLDAMEISYDKNHKDLK